MIEKKDVAHIARLARIKISSEEEWMAQLQKILDYFNKIKGVEIPFNLPSLPDRKVLPLRKDEKKLSLSVEQSLSNAPSQEAGLFTVPKILDK